jgi:diguanylate cyclase (GGDEF)-like protein
MLKHPPGVGDHGMKSNLRHLTDHPSRLPVIRYAVLLFLLTAALVVAVAVTLDRNAERSTWQQNTTALAGGARVGASAFGALRSNLRVQVSQLATSLPLQRAVVTENETELRQIAAQHHARITVHGRSTGTLAPAPHVVSTATITDGVHVLASITVALPLGNDILTLLRQSTPLPAHGALMLVRDGRVVAGGPVGADATARHGRITLGKTSFAVQSAPLPLAGMSLASVEPVSGVDAGLHRYRLLVLLAALATLALAGALATRLARPLAHVVGEVARLSRQAQTDALTGLANRGGLADRLEIELRRAAEDGTRVSFVIADVDNFKAINDGYGHQSGDEIIRAVAGAIAGAVREIDLAARYGGDEFAVVLPGARLADAKRTADRIRRAVAAIEPPGVADARVTMSFGVAEFPTYAGIDALVAAADAALYQAKWGGKNQVATATVQRQKPTEPSAPVLASIG